MITKEQSLISKENSVSCTVHSAKLITKRGFRGVKLHNEDYKVLLADNCALCGHAAREDKAIRWIAHDAFLCDECMDSPLLTLNPEDTAKANAK